MAEQSYRLGQYEIIHQDDGEIRWKAHGGFAAVKGGRCFVEGQVLFIGPGETEAVGPLKNEFLEYLRQFPPWDKTKFYCPSYTLYTCAGDRIPYEAKRKAPSRAEQSAEPAAPSVMPTIKSILSAVYPTCRVRQMKGRLQKTFRRGKKIASHGSTQDTPE